MTGKYADAFPCDTENVSSTIQPDWFFALNSKNRRDLPIPGSAIAATICPRPALRLLGRALERVHLALAAPRTSTSRAPPLVEAECVTGQAGDFINIDRLADAFDLGRTQRL